MRDDFAGPNFGQLQNVPWATASIYAAGLAQWIASILVGSRAEMVWPRPKVGTQLVNSDATGQPSRRNWSSQVTRLKVRAQAAHHEILFLYPIEGESVDRLVQAWVKKLCRGAQKPRWKFFGGRSKVWNGRKSGLGGSQ